MKITDGKRTVEINIMTWNGTGYGPDWAGEYFNAGALPYDEENDAYTVQSERTSALFNGYFGRAAP